jgi:hypothetical protein
MKLKQLTFVLLAALSCGCAAYAETVAVESPDGHLKLKIEVADGAVAHALAVDGKPLIAPLPVGFAGGHFAGVTRREENSVWKPVWGKRSVVSDHYREATLDFGGQMRTWPNAVTREFCQAQLDGYKVFQPRTFVTSVFVNLLAGPLDMNNGLADLTQAGRVDHGVPVPSTLTAEVARTLIVFSGATIIPDIPEHYRQHLELLRFIAAQQMPWRESKTLAGEIGEYIVMARQAADGNWLVGAATGESPREIDVPLSFLPSGKYEALVIQDGPKSDYRTHAEDYQAEKRNVSSTATLHLKLAPGGGACVLITTKR